MWVLWELDLTQLQEDPGKGRSREGSWRLKEKSFVRLSETPLVDKSEPPGKSEKPDTSFAELGLRRGDAWRGLWENRASAQLHICGCAAKSPVVWHLTVGRARTLEAEHLLWAWHRGESEDKQPPLTRVLSVLTL